jgi:Fe2+ transport system protein FeoA
MSASPLSHTTLDEMRPGETARVVSVSDGIPDGDRRRLLEIGLFPGTPVTVVRHSPLGDPTAYEVRGMVVALRRAQSRFIEVERVGS